MQIAIKRIDPTLPLPQYLTPGAAAFDFYARETTIIAAKSLGKIPSNLIIQTPPGYMLNVFSRSSLAQKKGLLLSNGVGIIDNDYSGPEDEILIPVYNFTDTPVTVERSERIAQGVFVKVEPAVWQEVAEMSAKSRGGFGTTGLV
jgi:dUTP pyrophosphatase